MGYLTATNAAYSAMADQMFSFWGQMLEAFIPESEKPQTRSWYVEPAPVRSVASDDTGAWRCMMPWMWMGADAAAGKPARAADDDPFSMSSWIRDPLQSWLDLAKPRTMMAVPMAFGMISAGIPHAVAWPAAQANVAMMEACNVMARSFEAAIENHQPNPSKR